MASPTWRVASSTKRITPSPRSGSSWRKVELKPACVVWPNSAAFSAGLPTIPLDTPSSAAPSLVFSPSWAAVRRTMVTCNAVGVELSVAETTNGREVIWLWSTVPRLSCGEDTSVSVCGVFDVVRTLSPILAPVAMDAAPSTFSVEALSFTASTANRTEPIEAIFRVDRVSGLAAVRLSVARRADRHRQPRAPVAERPRVDAARVDRQRGAGVGAERQGARHRAAQDLDVVRAPIRGRRPR